jgi:phage terminase large subunit
MITELRIPDKLAPLFTPSRFKVLYGGRGAGKTESIARVLIVRACQDRIRVLCTREVQTSIAQSVHSTLKSVINQLNLNSFFTVTDKGIKGINGSEFIFAGLSNETVSSIKSIASINYCWCEEASSLTQHSFDLLVPSIRAENSEIWFSLNREKDEDPVSKLFIISNPPPNSIVISINYWENPFFPEVMRQDMLHMKETDYDRYLHVYEGKPTSHSHACIFKDKFISKEFKPDEDLWSPLYGADLGFAVDPSVLLKCWVYEDRLYVEHEWYKIGVAPSLLPAYYDTIPGARNHIIYVDGGGLGIGTVNDLKRNGFPRVQAAPKWSGSINDGIERLRSFDKIVVHPRCPHTLYDLSNYSYKIDKRTEEILPEIVDKHSDCVDALRYAITPIIKGFKLKQIPDRQEERLDSFGNPIGKFRYETPKDAWLC